MLGDLAVNRMGFGAMRLAGAQSGAPGDRAQAIWVLRRAVGLGVNHIDTAAFYFSPSRSANELINSALAPYPDDLVITTKVWPSRDPSGEWYWAEPSQLRGQVEENLRQLGRDHLDVVNLRIPRSAEGASIAEHFAALAALRAAGLIHTATGWKHRPLITRCSTYAVHRASRSSRSSPSPARPPPGAGPPRPMRPSRRSPEHTTRRRLRSGWPGPCTAARTCSPFPAPATPRTSPKTSMRLSCACRRRRSVPWPRPRCPLTRIPATRRTKAHPPPKLKRLAPSG